MITILGATGNVGRKIADDLIKKMKRSGSLLDHVSSCEAWSPNRRRRSRRHSGHGVLVKAFSGGRRVYADSAASQADNFIAYAIRWRKH
jgi:uncharacterized protein YbjT (DUF2867 family)